MSNSISVIQFGIILLSIFLFSENSTADAVVLVSRGKNEVFINPSSSSSGPQPRVLFQGIYYTVASARIGQKVKRGDVVKTNKSGVVKVGFSSGDSLHVGPSSAIVVDLPDAGSKEKSEDKKGIAPTLNLIYGKMRAVISKNGPMKNTKVKTPAAIAGVRGTDFFVSYNPSESQVKTTVFRGKVEVVDRKSQKPMALVKSGYSYHFKKDLEKVEPSLTTKEEVKEIHQISNVSIKKEEFKKLKPDEKHLVKQTEQACRKAIFEDIKSTNPELAEEIEKKKISSSRMMNALSANQIYKSAPKAPPEDKKPSEAEMRKIIEDDIYEEQF